MPASIGTVSTQRHTSPSSSQADSVAPSPVESRRTPIANTCPPERTTSVTSPAGATNAVAGGSSNVPSGDHESVAGSYANAVRPDAVTIRSPVHTADAPGRTPAGGGAVGRHVSVAGS